MPSQRLKKSCTKGTLLLRKVCCFSLDRNHVLCITYGNTESSAGRGRELQLPGGGPSRESLEPGGRGSCDGERPVRPEGRAILLRRANPGCEGLALCPPLGQGRGVSGPATPWWQRGTNQCECGWQCFKSFVSRPRIKSLLCHSTGVCPSKAIYI